MFTSFTYIQGRWPNDFFYKYYAFLVPIMIFIRFVNYRPKKWHYFLLDFCYFGTGTVWLFLVLFPKNEILYRCAFLYSAGVLALATAAFDNALIFHKFDSLICLITHPVPLVALWNVRHVSMEYEKNLEEKDCRFLRHPENESFWTYDSFIMNFVYPYVGYLIWAVAYYMFNFVLQADKIKKLQYRTCLLYTSPSPRDKRQSRMPSSA